jgi:hypothetical protein
VLTQIPSIIKSTLPARIRTNDKSNNFAVANEATRVGWEIFVDEEGCERVRRRAARTGQAR